MSKRIHELTELTAITNTSSYKIAIDDSTFSEIKQNSLAGLSSYLSKTSSPLTVSSISGTDSASVTLTGNDGEYIPEPAYVRFSGSANLSSSGGDYDIQINLSQVYTGINGQKIEVDVYDGSDNYIRTIIGTIVGETPIAFQIQTGSVQTFTIRWRANLIKS